MDSRICQTSTASPAEPGGLSFWASGGRAASGNGRGDWRVDSRKS